MSSLIVRRLEFDAGHRVLNHQGKCRCLHGHRYVVEVGCVADDLDDLGMVVDFSVVKEEVGGWIDEHLDHNMLLHPDDPLIYNKTSTEIERIIGKWPFIMPSDHENPTAENISAVIKKKAIELLEDARIRVEFVRVWETPNCYSIPDWASSSEERASDF